MLFCLFRGLGDCAYQRANRAAASSRRRRSDRGARSATAALALQDEEVERLRLAHAEAREDGVRLTAVVGLVIEQVGEDVASPLALRCTTERAVVPVLLELRSAQGGHVGHDAAVFGLPGGTELCQVLEQDLGERRRLRAAAGEAVHPDAVGNQQMVERAVEAAEIRAGIAA